MNPTLLATSVVLGCALMGAAAQILLKSASDDLSANPVSWLTNQKMVVGALLYGAAFIFFVYVLKMAPVSYLYPIIATSYVWVALLAGYFLGEEVTVLRWLGIGTICFGVFLVTR